MHVGEKNCFSRMRRKMGWLTRLPFSLSHIPLSRSHPSLSLYIQLNEEDIEGTFGGPDSRSRGYYTSMYASSANAYMLMYRRIDRDANKG